MIIRGQFPALVGLALTLNLLLFSYLYVVNGNRKLLLLAGVIMAGLFVTYTVSFITAILFVILFFSLGLFFTQKKKGNVLGCGTIIFMGIILPFPWVLNILNRLTIEIPVKEKQALLAWFDASTLRSEFGSSNLFMYYGYWFFPSWNFDSAHSFYQKKSWELSISMATQHNPFDVK